MKNNPANFTDYEEFLNKSKKKYIRPAIWKWKDIEKELSGKEEISFTHEDADESHGICSSLNMLVQILKPSESGKPHRHTNFAIFIVKNGHGYSVIDEEKIEWEEGDVFFAPPWARHAHYNESETEQAVLYTVQDVPNVTNMGLWFFKGSNDDAKIQHIVDGNK